MLPNNPLRLLFKTWRNDIGLINSIQIRGCAFSPATTTPFKADLASPSTWAVRLIVRGSCAVWFNDIDRIYCQLSQMRKIFQYLSFGDFLNVG